MFHLEPSLSSGNLIIINVGQIINHYMQAKSSVTACRSNHVTTCRSNHQSPHAGQIISHHMQLKSSVTTCRSNHQSPHAAQIISHHMQVKSSVTTCRSNHVTAYRPNHQSPHAAQIISHLMQVKSSVTAPTCLSLQLVSAPLEMGTSYCAPRDVSHQSLCVRVAIISLHIHHYALLLTAANIPAQKSFLFSKPAERSRKVRQNHVKGRVDPVGSHHSI